MDDLIALAFLVLLGGLALLVFYSILIGAVLLLLAAGIILAVPVARGFLGALRERPRGR